MDRQLAQAGAGSQGKAIASHRSQPSGTNTSHASHSSHSSNTPAAIVTSDGRQVQLVSQDHQKIDPIQFLKPGQVLTGVVLEAFNNDTYLVNIRGRHLITESKLALQRDQAVSFEVKSQGNQLVLRLAGVDVAEG